MLRVAVLTCVPDTLTEKVKVILQSMTKQLELSDCSMALSLLEAQIGLPHIYLLGVSGLEF